MPQPKWKTSKSKRNMRRAHDALKVVGVSFCPNCGESKLPHIVCGACGHHRGRQVMEPRRGSTDFTGEDFSVED